MIFLARLVSFAVLVSSVSQAQVSSFSFDQVSLNKLGQITSVVQVPVEITGISIDPSEKTILKVNIAGFQFIQPQNTITQVWLDFDDVYMADAALKIMQAEPFVLAVSYLDVYPNLKLLKADGSDALQGEKAQVVEFLASDAKLKTASGSLDQLDRYAYAAIRKAELEKGIYRGVSARMRETADMLLGRGTFVDKDKRTVPFHEK